MSAAKEDGADAAPAVPPPPYAVTGSGAVPPSGFVPVVEEREVPEPSGIRAVVERVLGALDFSGAAESRLSGRGIGFGVIVCGIAAIATGILLLWARADPAPEPPPDLDPSPAASGSEPDPEGADGAEHARDAPPGEVVVHVGGQVNDPGLVELPEGSRVSDAVDAAGGLSEEADADVTDTLNLARRLVDGEQVLVGVDPPPGQAGPAGPDQEAAIDLNTATAEQLEALPGIGPVLAESIVEYRESNGGFGSVEELLEVRGIGEKRFEDLQDRVVVHGS